MCTPARIVLPLVTRVFFGLRGLALLLPACAPAVGPGDAPREAAAAAEAAPAAAASGSAAAPADAPFEAELDGAPPRAAAEAVARMPGRAEPSAHAERAAWSADGRTFVHCRSVPDLDCTECRFVDRDGTSQSLESGPACGESAVPRAALDARLAALAPDPTRWRDGTDVVLVVETREHETANDGGLRPMLKLGARRREGGPPAWLLHVDPCQGCGTDQVCAAAAHLDALALSPDGERLAVLIHQRGTGGDETLRVELLATERVAAAARGGASRSGP